MKSAIAIAAHPDDIEFMMAGTLLLLKKRGYDIHYFNLSTGNLGTMEYDAESIKNIRLREARKSAKVLNAHFHPPFCNDLEIFYNEEILRNLVAVIRKVKPKIVLTHSPNDYMEDHMNTCRLTVTACFARGMTNFNSKPNFKAEDFDCTIYHALPHTLRDPLRRRIMADSFVNTSSVQHEKLEALKAHQSQQKWLDVSQKLNSYLQAMVDASLEVGRMSKRFKHAEGWRRHLHYGFCGHNDNPLMDLEEDYLINEDYEKNL